MAQEELDSRRLDLKDHDMLVSLNIKMDNIAIDLKELRDGTADRLTKVESRVGLIEQQHDKIGGVEQSYKEFELVRDWVYTFQRTWKLIVFTSGIISATLGVVATLLSIRSGIIRP